VLSKKETELKKDSNIAIDDASLVEQCRKGDSAAMERLIRKYHTRIYNVILRICSDPEDAAELTQDTFVKIMEHIGKFEGRSGFYTWAFRIAVNLSINHSRRNVKLRAHSLDKNNENGTNKSTLNLKMMLEDPDAVSPEKTASDKELYELINQAIMKLEEPQRAVIVLRDVSGMSYADIAEILDIELGTVKSRISRARANLRDVLEEIVQ
jgi:RNA polymerase sigma-70 factor (ECF subfamily)